MPARAYLPHGTNHDRHKDNIDRRRRRAVLGWCSAGTFLVAPIDNTLSSSSPLSRNFWGEIDALQRTRANLIGTGSRKTASGEHRIFPTHQEDAAWLTDA
ncbi:hypothetical protein EVG20_g5491 [Dentipellis fragilis]|uniref:Uncharacterized protein n=1 Tax=Dentipellis fragilis TaxID=205917 RepID=A0A4Y9YSS1_9AGAM|nr:hypothetical protein EVG20_g5491 [Dentipellis fragilis]